jgi:hypothetical protein
LRILNLYDQPGNDFYILSLGRDKILKIAFQRGCYERPFFTNGQHPGIETALKQESAGNSAMHLSE